MVSCSGSIFEKSPGQVKCFKPVCLQDKKENLCKLQPLALKVTIEAMTRVNDLQQLNMPTNECSEEGKSKTARSKMQIRAGSPSKLANSRGFLMQ
eukprot:5575282-Amphidinium_carterae.1